MGIFDFNIVQGIGDFIGGIENVIPSPIRDALRFVLPPNDTGGIMVPIGIDKGRLIHADNPTDVLKFGFNPLVINIKKSPNWVKHEVPGLSHKQPHYVSGGDMTIQFSIILDDRDCRRNGKHEKNMVDNDIAWLMSKTVPERDFSGFLKEAPPKLMFVMGERAILCHLDDVDIKLRKFWNDGTTKQAEIGLTLFHAPNEHRNPNDMKEIFVIGGDFF